MEILRTFFGEIVLFKKKSVENSKRINNCIQYE
jgi:hypothetical protein